MEKSSKKCLHSSENVFTQKLIRECLHADTQALVRRSQRSQLHERGSHNYDFNLQHELNLIKTTSITNNPQWWLLKSLYGYVKTWNSVHTMSHTNRRISWPRILYSCPHKPFFDAGLILHIMKACRIHDKVFTNALSAPLCLYKIAAQKWRSLYRSTKKLNQNEL